MDELEKVRERVRKLLRLATSPNVSEAANAAAFAQSLIARYRLHSLVNEAAHQASAEPVTAFFEEPLDASKRLREWKIELAAVLAQVNDCRIFVQAGRTQADKIDRLIVVGRRVDFDNMRELFAPMVKMVDCLTRAHGVGRDRKWCDGFRLGVVTTLRERLQYSKTQAADELAALQQPLAAAALVVWRDRQEAVLSWIKDNLAGATPMRGPKVIVAAYDHGRLAGQELPLPAAMNPPKKPR